MIFFIDYFGDSAGSLVKTIESHGLHIAPLFIIPIIIDLCKYTVVRFEKLGSRLPFGVVRHWESVNHLVVFVDNFQTCVMDPKYSAFVVSFTVAVPVTIRYTEKIFFSRW